MGLLEVLQITLTKEGFTNIQTASTGIEAIELVKKFSFDLIILDIMLPDMDGLEVCRQMRLHTNALILFLTAKDEDIDKIMGLTVGGDDYITKPFNPLEIVARVKAHLRRQKLSSLDSNNNTPSTVYQLSETVCVVKESGQLLVNNKEIDCPAKEFELLVFLCEHPNKIFSVRQLYQYVWGELSLGDEKTISVHISRLRKKIEYDPKNPSILINYRGLGYKLLLHGKGNKY